MLSSVTVALVVVLAGCGEDVGASQPGGGTVSTGVTVTEEASREPSATETEPPRPPGGTPSAPVSLSPDGPVVPEGVRQVPSSQVDASAVPEYYDHRGEVWVYDGGYSLQMFAAASSGCGGVEARVVDQSAEAVRIVVRALPAPQGGSPDDPVCTTVITPRPVTVALDAPLGERRVFLAGGR
ncbi:hypothetical protein BU204_14455 [Actinophytocola xanthii]|uniref:Uncharacterized protein n=1 Tax=Actinophytocola xanthii TaxID=1912961 RepID=A0A1Q8CRA9_9PSEU|nr:hypothetical protein BU204_14455 [Actinophytocola xanthii]